MALFKYMERKWAENFLNEGEILIGTLGDFRKSENHSDDIADAGEGTKTIHLKKNQLYTNVSNMPPSLPPFFHCESGGKIQLGADTKINIKNDYFVLCLSEVKSFSIMKRMSKSYDTCIEIVDPTKFLLAIKIAFSIKAPQYKSVECRCTYIPSRVFDENTDQGYSEAFMKPQNYSYQQEFRIVFDAQNLPKEKMIIKSLEAAKYCKIITLDPNG